MQALSIRNLRKTYPGGLEALKGIDLDVETGDFFALLGPNGAGKSTAIGIICSLVKAGSGTVTVFGKNMHEHRQLVKSYIGLVPQEVNFNQFDTVRQILVNQAGYYGIPRKEALKRSELCLKQMDLWDKRDTVSRRLSGGMKRRVMIARALVHNPQLLILDEPTAGVDIEIRRSMWALMREVNAQGTTIILTTHYLEEAESLCRTIAIIDHGEIVEKSDMAGLLARLHIDHFVLDLAGPLLETPHIDGYRLQKLGERSLAAAVPKESGLNRLFIELARQNIEVLSLKNQSNRLEQLFLDLTGKK
ncbi:MAG: ABC transporter ATP-binding protein [Gammaproteobacteria bacterium]